MQDDYNYIMQHVFASEGGYGWDPNDTGGPTKYGITCYDLAEHRGQKMTSMTTWAPIVKAMTKDEAEDIYRSKYANGVRYAELNYGKDYTILDYGINSGISRPIKVAQTLLKLPVTGKMDDKTLAAINASDVDWFINAVHDERLHFMKGIRGGSDWVHFGKGWQTRVDSVLKVSDALAHQKQQTTEPVGDPAVPEKKAINQPNPSIVKEITVAAGSILTVLSGYINYVAPKGINLEFLVGAGVILAVGGIIYYIWHNKLVDDANNKVVLPQTV